MDIQHVASALHNEFKFIVSERIKETEIDSKRQE